MTKAGENFISDTSVEVLFQIRDYSGVAVPSVHKKAVCFRGWDYLEIFAVLYYVRVDL